jgi:O-antigen/teichoic acid export membrane protein
MYESFRFGWPLLASGFLLFGVFQGDRMLIAGAYSMSDLGVYAVASTLAMAPMFTLYKVFGPVSLPVLARAQRDLPKFRTFYGLSAQALALCGTVFVVAMILGGETVITLLFGEKYREAGVLAAWLTVGQSVRILRAAPTNAALAKGDTVNSFLSNLWRLLGLGLAVPVVLFKLDLRWIAVAGGLGELLALGASLVRLRRKHNVPFGDCLCPGILMLILTLTAFLVRGGSAPTHIASTLALAVLGCAVSLTVFGVVFADLRRVSFSLLSDVRLRLTNISQNARLRRAANRA